VIANNLPWIATYVVPALLVLAVGTLARRAWLTRGFAESTRTTVGQVTAIAFRGSKAFVRVQKVRNSLAPGVQVGLEIYLPTAAENSRTLLTLSPSEAESMIKLVQAVASDRVGS
jgi:hypothetical protein